MSIVKEAHKQCLKRIREAKKQVKNDFSWFQLGKPTGRKPSQSARDARAARLEIERRREERELAENISDDFYTAK